MSVCSWGIKVFVKWDYFQLQVRSIIVLLCRTIFLSRSSSSPDRLRCTCLPCPCASWFLPITEFSNPSLEFRVYQLEHELRLKDLSGSRLSTEGLAIAAFAIPSNVVRLAQANDLALPARTALHLLNLVVSRWPHRV